ncbi:hypothetical protein LWM68_28620 [Niabella sp. W65]|nr:hypothetical protein [Niabella sp. W65]MCH7366386.1 hypothetical protein [Niabella sp. W65]ULT42103.1 hypothetical protein KRR40_00065 [Niabella sp. I65]
MKRIFMFIGLSCTAGSSLFAQRDSIPSDSVQLLTPVEVRSTRLNEKSPFAVSNIGKKKLPNRTWDKTSLTCSTRSLLWSPVLMMVWE